jgi:hypothetical protein
MIVSVHYLIGVIQANHIHDYISQSRLQIIDWWPRTNATMLLLNLFLLFKLTTGVTAHMRLKVPDSRNPDDDMNPVNKFCGNFSPKPKVTYEAGKSFTVEIEGYSPHGGGGCAFSLSYDNGKTFTVIHVTGTDCPATKKYSITIPQDAPSCDQCIFAWSWVPVESGLPQHYMGCADIKIKGTQSGNSYPGITLPPVNLEEEDNYNADIHKWHHNNPKGNTLPWINAMKYFGALAGGGSVSGRTSNSGGNSAGHSSDNLSGRSTRRKCNGNY